jgi:hypothetical protein
MYKLKKGTATLKPTIYLEVDGEKVDFHFSVLNSVEFLNIANILKDPELHSYIMARLEKVEGMKLPDGSEITKDNWLEMPYVVSDAVCREWVLKVSKFMQDMKESFKIKNLEADSLN